MHEEGDTEDEMISKLIGHAASRGCYVSSIKVFEDGNYVSDIVHDTITNLLNSNTGQLNAVTYRMLELFNWEIRDPADVHSDILAQSSRSQPLNQFSDQWNYRSDLNSEEREKERSDAYAKRVKAYVEKNSDSILHNENGEQY